MIFNISISYAQIISIPQDYPTIQQGIDTASNGDTVLVAPGIYFENIKCSSKNIVLASHYLFDNDTNTISNTIIDGSQMSSVIKLFNTDTSFRLIGFTITNGYTNWGGGGIFINHSFGTLQDLIVENNTAYEYGGGIYIADGSPSKIRMLNIKILNNFSDKAGGGLAIYSYTLNAWSTIRADNIIVKGNSTGAGQLGLGGGIAIRAGHLYLNNSTIQDNSAEWGGGIYFRPEGYFNLNNVKINNNVATKYGGGIYSEYSFLEFNNTEITNNIANKGGGLIIITPLRFENFKNLLIADNHAHDKGGGVYLINGIFETTNSTFANNTAEYGSCIYVGNLKLDLKNSILFGFDKPQQIYCDSEDDSCFITINHSLIQGGKYYIETNDNAQINWLEGNINRNPEYVESGEFPYQINDNSPCIDAGSNDTTGITEFDLAGNLRFVNSRIDMGAYEWDIFVGSSENNDFTDSKTIITYPNPARTKVSIEISNYDGNTLEINIYDINGKLVRSETSETDKSSSLIVTIPISNIQNGLYLLEIKQSDKNYYGKFVVER